MQADIQLQHVEGRGKGCFAFLAVELVALPGTRAEMQLKDTQHAVLDKRRRSDTSSHKEQAQALCCPGTQHGVLDVRLRSDTRSQKAQAQALPC